MKGIDKKQGTIPEDVRSLPPLRFPVLEHGAESLVQGYLMRRNILTYQRRARTKGTIFDDREPTTDDEV